MIDTTACPSGKQQHMTRAEAEHQKVSIVTQRGDRDVTVYRCPLCKGYHVGHEWHRGAIRTTPEYKAKLLEADLMDREMIEEDEA